ncbi:DUF2125 domain-containing protein [Lichenihabitans psoromatis]|uniref:DUF2125 domain-containing protein n=1 Tax=Lichenihabitans psoromatis TaxID=2528642 RepID=UPI001036325D|nr:DUF2125 domain-containing protein [Lichenihabitans psoromatis]
MSAPQNGVRQRRSRTIPIAIASVVGVVAIWSGLWGLAANRAGAAFDDWLAQQAHAGRQWTCPDRHIGGYPFALRIRCDKPTFQGEIAGRQSTGNVEGLLARLGLDAPRTIRVDLMGPMHLRADNGDYDLMVSWAGLRVAASGLPDMPRGGEIEATRLAVTLSQPDAADLNARAAQLSALATPNVSDAADADFDVKALGVGLPTLDGFTGGNDLIEASLNGTLTHADLLSAPTVARLEAWRQADGQLQVTGLSVRKGDFVGQASGVLALDEAHRTTGKLDTALTGFEPIAERFGLPISSVKLGGLLSSLLGGKKAQTPQAGNALRLPVIFSGGRLRLGPIALPVRLDPIY